MGGTRPQALPGPATIWQMFKPLLIKYQGPMKRKINHNDLIPWFLEDHDTLPTTYLASCQRFFLELDRRQTEKHNKKNTYENKRS